MVPEMHEETNKTIRETEDKIIRDMLESSACTLDRPSREDVLYGLERLKRRLNFMHGQELEDFLQGDVVEMDISPYSKTGLKKRLNIKIV